MIGKVLITGGSGLVGRVLTNLLISNGFDVVWLSRSTQSKVNNVKQFQWDIQKQYIDPLALDVDYVIHLAGSNVGDKKWTPEHKKDILDSRVESTKLLFEEISKLETKPKAFISASAIGIYGLGKDGLVKDETSIPENDFLAQVTQQWEKEAFQFEKLGIRTVCLRIGLVLSNEGGALPKMLKPIKYYVGAPLGSGEQFQSWIHVVDLARMFLWAMQEPISGPYNAVAPFPVTNKVLTKAIAKTIHKPLILPNVPEWALNIILGEMAAIVVNGSYVSCKKALEDGFVFHFTEIEPALKNLLA